MKKSTLVLTALFAFATAGFSQKISFGIKAGISHNQLTYAITSEDEDGKLEGTNTGFQIGGVAEIKLSNHFALRPNILFAMKGGGILEGVTIKVSTMHIDVPINFVYTTNGFFIGAGPNFSYALSGKIKPEGSEQDYDIFDKDEAAMYLLKKFEIGANVVMGYTLPNGLMFSANFTPGLNNIYDAEQPEGVEVASHFKSFGFSIGYMFGAKGK